MTVAWSKVGRSLPGWPTSPGRARTGPMADECSPDAGNKQGRVFVNAISREFGESVDWLLTGEEGCEATARTYI